MYIVTHGIELKAEIFKEDAEGKDAAFAFAQARACYSSPTIVYLATKQVKYRLVCDTYSRRTCREVLARRTEDES